MPCPLTTYIVIEVREKENALDIMNVLMTHTKARFTLTNDIEEYAQERSHLKKPLEEAPRAAPTELVKKRTIQQPFDVYMEPPAHKRAFHQSTDNDVEIIETKPQIQPFGEERQNDVSYGFDNYTTQQDNQFEDDGWNIDQHPTSSTHAINRSTVSNPFDAASWAVPTPAETQLSKSRVVHTFQCKICLSHVKIRGFDYYKRSSHAIIHTPIMRYVCPIDNCGYKVRHRADVIRHIKLIHKLDGVKHTVKDCMTPEQAAELREVVNRCFPEMKNRSIQRRSKQIVGGSEDQEDDVEEEEEDNDEDN